MSDILAVTRRIVLSGLILSVLALPALAQETRTIDTPRGPVTIPVDPQRVVTTYSSDNDYALVLGLPLVGAGTARGEVGQGFAEHQAAYNLGNPEPIAIFPATNYEQIAGLKPDLIISNYLMEENGYELMSAIAPTLWFSIGTGWRDILRTYGAALDRSERAEAFIADFDKRLAMIAARVPKGQTLALVNNFNDGTFVIMQAEHLGTLYRDLGFTPSANVPATHAERVPYSNERIDLLADADIILLWRNRNDDGSFVEGVYDGMKAIPGWEDLKAVKTGRVYDIPVEYFYESPLTATKQLDVVENVVLAGQT